MEHCIFKVAQSPIDLHEALCFVAAKGNGATSSFIGTIRDVNFGKAVIGVSYDLHESLARVAFAEVCTEAIEKWGEALRIYVVHYQGRLQVGETSIVIAVGSPHRDEAFKACRYLIEEIKHRFPIWKQEHYQNGDSEWVKGHALCQGH